MTAIVVAVLTYPIPVTALACCSGRWALLIPQVRAREEGAASLHGNSEVRNCPLSVTSMEIEMRIKTPWLTGNTAAIRSQDLENRTFGGWQKSWTRAICGILGRVLTSRPKKVISFKSGSVCNMTILPSIQNLWSHHNARQMLRLASGRCFVTAASRRRVWRARKLRCYTTNSMSVDLLMKLRRRDLKLDNLYTL